MKLFLSIISIVFYLEYGCNAFCVDKKILYNERKYFYNQAMITRSKAYRRKRISLGSTIGEVEAMGNAFVGGTVGVMSTAFILEMKKISDQRLEGCPYCLGSGQILCGSCIGTGITNLGQPNQCSCSQCSGIGLITCVNCKGDGRATPIILQSRATRDPEYASQTSISIDSP